jgi:glyoxylase-like metal-dependent hydrolase (beta-lactamase superfamily II)
MARAAGNVWELRGAGCNLAASVGRDGVLLVDSGYPRTSSAVMKALRKVMSADPRVEYLVVTHGHFDHGAAARALSPNGVVVMHENAIAELREGSEFVPGFRIPGLAELRADITTAQAVTIHFNGEKVHVISAPSHTAGDLMVWFEGSRVLHLGDNYFGDATVRLNPGTSPAHYYEAMGSLLEQVPDDAIVLSGHAAPVPASKLRAAYAASRSIFDFVHSQLAAGLTDEAILEAAEQKGHPRPWVEHFLKHR